MTPEEHRLLVETRDLALENAKALKSLRRSHIASSVFRVLYWVVIIGVSLGAYYFIQPYVDALRSMLGDIGGIGSVSPRSASIDGALENIRAIKEIYTN